LHDFLDSFLQFRSRWYDFPFHGVKGIVAGVIVGELELCRRVFMVLYRISSNRDPGAKAADSLSQKDHEGGLLLFVYSNPIQLLLLISF
jgi:activating signal cointegrator complex subunit 2